MQGIGHLIIKGETIKVLWRTNFHKKRFGVHVPDYVALRLRKTGKEGQRMTDEEAILSLPEPDSENFLKRLMNGETIKL